MYLNTQLNINTQHSTLHTRSHFINLVLSEILHMKNARKPVLRCVSNKSYSSRPDLHITKTLTRLCVRSADFPCCSHIPLTQLINVFREAR